MDLALRGAGELGGGKQWGISDIGMEAIKNIKMVEAAREEARRLLEEDLMLTNYPLLRERLLERGKATHFE
jgi:RecG-like helicase